MDAKKKLDDLMDTWNKQYDHLMAVWNQVVTGVEDSLKLLKQSVGIDWLFLVVLILFRNLNQQIQQQQ